MWKTVSIFSALGTLEARSQRPGNTRLTKRQLAPPALGLEGWGWTNAEAGLAWNTALGVSRSISGEEGPHAKAGRPQECPCG